MDQGTSQSLPGVMRRFFEAKGGHSLILKGPAGTGKTTLALQAVEAMSDTQQTHYISSRVSDASLHAQFPWLAEKNRQRDILVASLHFLKVLYPASRKGGFVQATLPDALLEACENLLKVLAHDGIGDATLERGELRKLEGHIESGEADDLSEGGAGTGKMTGDTITFDIGSDLPEVEAAYDIVEAAHPRKAMVVFDSIDALAEKYGVSQTRLVNTIQKDIVEKAHANVVYVLESHGPTALDYLGDGVVSLSMGDHIGRRVRVLCIEKLRGIPVPHPNMNYSLLGGRIRIFEPQDFKGAWGQRVSPGSWKPRGDIDDRHVSTGNAYLDNLLGGFRSGSINIFEFGSGVPDTVSTLFASAIASNFAAMGRGVAYLPPGRGNAHSANEALCMYMEEETFLKHVRVFETNVIGGSSEERLPNVMLIEGSDADIDFRWDNIDYNLTESTKPKLSLLSIDMLRKIYGTDGLEDLNNHLFSLRRTGGIFVGLDTGEKTWDAYASSATLHVRFERLGTSVVMYGEKPYTMLHEVVVRWDDGVPILGFIPVM